MALHVLDEAKRCLGCKKPMCQQGCPIHTNIPMSSACSRTITSTMPAGCCLKTTP